MASFHLSPMVPDDIPRLAEIQKAAFEDDRVNLAAFGNVSPSDYLTWVEHGLAHPDPPTGQRIEIMCARDKLTSQVAGWARWYIPLGADEKWAGAATEKAPIPHGADERVFTEWGTEGAQHKERIMGGRKRWTLSIIVVDPAFQRRGIGALLVNDGVSRANSQALPIILSSSPQGMPLYAKLGFELKDTCVVSSANIVAPFLVKEP